VELTGEESKESQEELDLRLRQGSSFGTAAAAYAEHRPGYAEAAVRWALEPVASREPLRVLDLAAGTGKLTTTLVRLGTEDALRSRRRHTVPTNTASLPPTCHSCSP